MRSSLVALSALAAFSTRAVAQVASNSTVEPPVFNNDDAILIVQIPNSGGPDPIGFAILPITSQAYYRLPHGAADRSYTNASLILNTPGHPTSATTIPSYGLAYTSCDAADYTSGNIDMETVVQQAISGNATGILFYSQVSPDCNITDLTPYGSYLNLYTMSAQNESTWLLNNLTGPFSYNMAGIFSGIAYNNFKNQQLGYVGGGSTAIAMIILYSITGVITALFLIIIITGAIRAHRHPERYGPRNVLGRSRQSRAKGIARAMLDTIPIVKFGENRNDAAKDDVEGQPATELQSRDTAAHTNLEATELQTVTATHVSPGDTPSPDKDAKAADEATGENGASSSAQDAAIAQHSEQDPQGCSICTDDFERGQDIRVLPCGHQFHPACVDPWLLDVSGTCPLCRVDLNPAGNPSDDLPPPLGPESPGPRSRRDTLRAFLARSRGDDLATREERLDALRRWRAQNRAAAARSAANIVASTRGDSTAAEDGAPEVQLDNSRLGRFSRLVRRR